MKIGLSRKHIPILATVGVFVLLYVAAMVRYTEWDFSSFAMFMTSMQEFWQLSMDVMVDLLRENAYLGVAAVGMTFVILSGGIDLSVGAMVGFISIFVATMIEKQGMHPGLAIPIALAVGVAFGASMGCIIAFFRLPPFLVTLAGMFLARGVALVISKESIGIKHAMYGAITDLDFPIPATALIFIAVLIVGIYIAQYTRFGRTVYAIGGNEQSALLMGLPVASMKIRIYALSGFCSATAGVVWTIFTSSGRALGGEMLELDAIASVVIGGTLLSGGVGYVAGTLFGVLIYGVILTIITFEGFNSWWTRIAVGVLLLGFILMQRLIQTRAARK
jgi:galactofuranose transport system permease protein